VLYLVVVCRCSLHLSVCPSACFYGPSCLKIKGFIHSFIHSLSVYNRRT